MPTFLEVQNLSKNFSQFQAVNDLSFTVHRGDIYGFLGQNGAGKSTTIRMLLSLIKPTAGTIFFEGNNIQQNKKTWLQHCGALIERPDLYKYLSAIDNLEIFARLSGLRLTKIALMQQLADVGLASRAKDKVGTFSQGMKQRLGIAIALVHNPQLVILDEPTNGLDPQGIADVRELIIDLQKQKGKTVIISSHLLHEIELTATRMIIIDKGKKIIEGEVKQLVNPAASVIEIQTEDDSTAFLKLSTSTLSHLISFEDKVLTIKEDRKNIPSIINQLQQLGIDVQAIIPRNSLEDYFLNITRQPA